MDTPSTTTSATATTTATATATTGALNRGQVEVEIVSEDEMAFLEAALASTRSFLSSSRCTSLISSSSSSLRRRSFSTPSGAPLLHSCRSDGPKVPDMEDSAPALGSRRLRLPRRSLSVTDITGTEWCEKQMEFTLVCGKPEVTPAMKAGSHRHAKLEEEVIQSVKVYVKSEEDGWALKFLNFIVGVNQLLFEGLTRELPIVGFLEGAWVVGIIDELRLDLTASRTSPLLVDTKTRIKATLPSEAQKRNARLQLMCYKYLWDSNISSSFYAEQFLGHFHLKQEFLLSDVVKEYGASLGFQINTFQDVFVHFMNFSQSLSPSEDRMILRYEFQKDNSLLGEYVFAFDECWFKSQVKKCIEFLHGTRQATFVSDDEQFKCRYCSFSNQCPRSALVSRNVQ